jgi:hypothetical protein
MPTIATHKLPPGPGPEFEWYDAQFEIDPNSWRCARTVRPRRGQSRAIDYLVLSYMGYPCSLVKVGKGGSP